MPGAELLAEAARSDRLVAAEKLRAGDERTAFAHLARACDYHPHSYWRRKKQWPRSIPGAITVRAPGCLVTGLAVVTAEFSPDGRAFSPVPPMARRSCGDAESGKVLLILFRSHAFRSQCSVRRQGSRIITASHDKTARVWDAATAANS